MRWLPWLAAALAAGCATVPAPEDVLSGRLSVRVDALGDQPARSLASAFELRGDAERGELKLTSPLGSVIALARWTPGEATLATPSSEARYTDLDALSRDALGESLPLRALPAWLRGRPWTGAPSTANGSGFEQLGWQIGLARQAEGWVEARRESPPAVTVRARLETVD